MNKQAERIKELVAESGISQNKFAIEYAGCAKNHLCNIANGKQKLTKKMATRICNNYFEKQGTIIRPEWLMGEDVQKLDMSLESITRIITARIGEMMIAIYNRGFTEGYKNALNTIEEGEQ